VWVVHNTTLETVGEEPGMDSNGNPLISHTDITIGVDGNPLISHIDILNTDLELYVCDDPACSSGTNVTLVTTGSVGVFSSITTGDDGNPVIAHQEYAKGDLEFAQVVMPDSVVAYQ